jgi:hypothetical protein
LFKGEEIQSTPTLVRKFFASPLGGERIKVRGELS